MSRFTNWLVNLFTFEELPDPKPLNVYMRSLNSSYDSPSARHASAFGDLKQLNTYSIRPLSIGSIVPIDSLPSIIDNTESNLSIAIHVGNYEQARSLVEGLRTRNEGREYVDRACRDLIEAQARTARMRSTTENYQEARRLLEAAAEDARIYGIESEELIHAYGALVENQVNRAHIRQTMGDAPAAQRLHQAAIADVIHAMETVPGMQEYAALAHHEYETMPEVREYIDRARRDLFRW